LRFCGVNALTDLNLAIDSSTIQAIIGPNGAGKSSLLN
jgi:branched-chain amino acid transport system ATP-binding protein